MSVYFLGTCFISSNYSSIEESANLKSSSIGLILSDASGNERDQILPGRPVVLSWTVSLYDTGDSGTSYRNYESRVYVRINEGSWTHLTTIKGEIGLKSHSYTPTNIADYEFKVEIYSMQLYVSYTGMDYDIETYLDQEIRSIQVVAIEDFELILSDISGKERDQILPGKRIDLTWSVPQADTGDPGTSYRNYESRVHIKIGDGAWTHLTTIGGELGEKSYFYTATSTVAEYQFKVEIFNAIICQLYGNGL